MFWLWQDGINHPCEPRFQIDAQLYKFQTSWSRISWPTRLFLRSSLRSPEKYLLQLHVLLQSVLMPVAGTFVCFMPAWCCILFLLTTSNCGQHFAVVMDRFLASMFCHSLCGKDDVLWISAYQIGCVIFMWCILRALPPSSYDVLLFYFGVGVRVRVVNPRLEMGFYVSS